MLFLEAGRKGNNIRSSLSFSVILLNVTACLWYSLSHMGFPLLNKESNKS